MTGQISKLICVGLAVFFALGSITTVRAQDCPPLVKITSVKLERLPNARRVLVPVTINNVPKKFLLDTAGLAGFITKEAADDLKLPSMSFSSLVRPIKTFGIGTQTYELANTESNDTTLISSRRETGTDRDGEIDGTLVNPFLLSKGELDLDFPGGTLSLFSPDHCPGTVNHWGSKDIGYLPLSANMIGTTADIRDAGLVGANPNLRYDIGHLTVPVTLDGKKFNAWIDTSAEKSSITIESAERIFGLTKSALGAESEAKLLPEQAMGLVSSRTGKIVDRFKVYRRKFSNLAIGHLDINNMELLIVSDKDGRNADPARSINYMPVRFTKTIWNEDIAGTGRQIWHRRNSAEFTNSYQDVPDLVLGMDVLRHLHIYLSLKESRMYFSTGASTPPVPAGTSAAK